MKIYISGKITGLPIEEARNKFKYAKERLKDINFIPVNPMEETEYKECKKWEEYMAEDIRLLLDCEAIYMLNNWKESKGAIIEHNLAVELGLFVHYQKI